jgi:uncharacterized protein (TIGR02246 family)
MITIGENSTGDMRDVETITRTLRDAGRAVERRDPDGVADMFAPGDDTTIFDFLAPGVTTVEDIRRNVADMAETAVGEIVCTYPKVTVRMLSPDIGYSLSYTEIDITTEDGTRTHVHAAVTDIWQRIDGRWLCVHEHSSLPVDVASAKAQLLQPI